MAGPCATDFVKLEDIAHWYRDPAHAKLNKFFDAFATIVKQVKTFPRGPKILLAVRDETVEEFEVLIDMSQWPDFDKNHEFIQGDIIFFKRAVVPASKDILLTTYISTFDLCPQSTPSQVASPDVHQSPFRYWSPNHIIVANEAKCRRRITELRDFVKNKTTPRKRKADSANRTPGSATSSRSISLDSPSLSFAFNPNDDEASRSPTTANKFPPLKVPRMSSTPKSKGSQTPSKAHDSSNNSAKSRSPSVRRKIIESEPDTSDDDATIVGGNLSTSKSSSESGDLTIIETEEENLEHSGDERPLENDVSSPNESFQTATSPPSHSVANEIEPGSETEVENEIFEETREYFEQDNEPEFPFINPVPTTCKFITFDQIKTHQGNYFVVKGMATKCSIDDDDSEEEDLDPNEPSSQHLENRLTVAKIVDLFCRQCKLQIPLIKRLKVDLFNWLSSQDGDQLEYFKCPTCEDVDMAFTFNVSLVISEVFDESKEEEEESHRRKTRSSPKKKAKTPVTIKALFGGLSAILYFGQRPEDALISEYNSALILKGIRAIFATNDTLDSGIRWWYIVKLNNCEENTIAFDYSIITIIADEADTTEPEQGSSSIESQ